MCGLSVLADAEEEEWDEVGGVAVIEWSFGGSGSEVSMGVGLVDEEVVLGDDMPRSYI